MKSDTIIGRETLGDLLGQFSHEPAKGRLMEHEVLRKFREQNFNKEQATYILSQYWYPLDNFPHFLAGVIHKTPVVPIQTCVSKILYQELGEGDPDRAHSSFYRSTMAAANLDVSRITHTARARATAALEDGYNASVDAGYCQALGYLYATEVSDLQIVSSIGAAVRSATGMQSLPWVDVHVVQEPEHVDNVDKAMSCEFTDDEVALLLEGAREMWTLWIDFFDDIGERIGA